MHDLRKKALLESGKTTSKKARSKESTPPSSRPMSRTNSYGASPQTSRVASRVGSDDESEFSDGTEWSTNSLDAVVAPSELDDASDAWIAAFDETVNALVDRKRSHTEGRETMIKRLITMLTRHFARDELKTRIGELLPTLLKSVKSGQSDLEKALAVKALALILITDPSESLYDEVQASFKTVINDSKSVSAKIAAIHALGVASFYGGASVTETEEVLEFLLDIVSSDGVTVGAEDDPEVVIAALEEWGFLATSLDDMEDATEAAMDTFVDQLESSDVGVQVASGDNIALLFEKSYTEAESDDEPEENDEDDSEGNRMVKRYTVYRQTHHLQQILEGLAKASSKRISKKDRKHMHLQFNDVLNTIEKPTRGPRYSTALDEEGREMGSRMKIAIYGGGKMTIDKWWKLHRLNGLKRLLQSGFMVHYEHNGTIFDSLPVMVEDD